MMLPGESPSNIVVLPLHAIVAKLRYELAAANDSNTEPRTSIRSYEVQRERDRNRRRNQRNFHVDFTVAN